VIAAVEQETRKLNDGDLAVLRSMHSRIKGKVRIATRRAALERARADPSAA